MKEMTRTADGTVREIETEGPFLGFFSGDIITCECGMCDWDGKYIMVKGFDFACGEIYGIEFDGVEIDYDVAPKGGPSGGKLKIVQRNLTWFPMDRRERELQPEFKEGDEVVVLYGAGAGFQGKIITIDEDTRVLKACIIELFGYRNGTRARPPWEKPDKPNTLLSTCIWKEEHDLMLLADFEDLKKRGSREIPIRPRIVTREEQAKVILKWYLANVAKDDGKLCPAIRPDARIEEGVDVSEEELRKLLSDEFFYPMRKALRELGVFLYEMLTGHSEYNDISFLLLGNEYPPIREYNPTISEKLSGIIERMIRGDIQGFTAL